MLLWRLMFTTNIKTIKLSQKVCRSISGLSHVHKHSLNYSLPHVHTPTDLRYPHFRTHTHTHTFGVFSPSARVAVFSEPSSHASVFVIRWDFLRKQTSHNGNTLTHTHTQIVFFPCTCSRAQWALITLVFCYQMELLKNTGRPCYSRDTPTRKHTQPGLTHT